MILSSDRISSLSTISGNGYFVRQTLTPSCLRGGTVLDRDHRGRGLMMVCVGGWGGGSTKHYSVTTGLISTLRWATMRAILIDCGGQTQKTICTKCNSRREKESRSGESNPRHPLTSPVLNWANVCSPEHTSDTSTNYDSFLN